MADRNRCTVTVGSIEVRAAAAEVSFGSSDEIDGMPVMGAHDMRIGAWIDIHDSASAPFDAIQGLFNLAYRPEAAAMQDIKIEFWRDDATTDVVCSFSFKGWIKRFRVANFAPQDATTGVSDALTAVNHLLYLELCPELGEANIRELAIGN